MQKIIVPLSKSKIMLLLVASVLFVIAGYWMFGLDAAEVESHRRFNSPLLVHGIGLASIVFGGLGVIAIARKLVDSSPGLVLDERGLTDNSSAFSAGLIPWPDITGFEIRQIQKQRILYVLLKDPDKYISRFGPVKQALLKANQRIAASPVAITSSSLSIGFDELVALIDGHFEASRRGA
jgi:hypothetical protein